MAMVRKQVGQPGHAAASVAAVPALAQPGSNQSVTADKTRLEKPMQPATAPLATLRNVMVSLTNMKGGVSLKRCKKNPDGSFIQREFTVWYDFDGQRHYICSDMAGKTFTDHGNKTEAYERAIRLLVAINNEMDAHKHDPTRYKAANKNHYSVMNVTAEYIVTRKEDVKNQRVGKAQLTNILRDIGYFTAFLEKAEIEDMRDIRAHHLQAHFNALPQKRVKDENGDWCFAPWKPKSQKNHHVHVGAFLRWAAKMEYIPRIPTMPPAPFVPQGRIRFYTDKEQCAVLAAMPPEHAPIFEFMAWCGCRPGEARALQMQDVADGVIMLQAAFNRSGELSNTKTKRMRPLPIDDTIGPILTAAMRNRIAGFIFTNPTTGNAYLETEVRYQWDKAIKKSGVRYLGITEGTRKTVATRLINNGVEPHMISDILGNSPKVLKQHYAQITASRYSGILGNRYQTVTKGKKGNASD